MVPALRSASAITRSVSVNAEAAIEHQADHQGDERGEAAASVTVTMPP